MVPSSRFFILVLVIANALVFKFTEGQRDFYSWLEGINNIDSENVPGRSSCRWEIPPEDGYSFSPCSTSVCKGVPGSYKRSGTVRVTQCKKHFTLTQGSDRDVCDNGKWSSEGHRCLPCGRSQRPLNPTGNLSLSSTSDFPWQAALYAQIDSQGQWEIICGGTLISPKIVVSAAHCLYISGTEWQAENVRVGFGKVNSLYSPKSSSVLSTVVEVARLDSYDGLYRPYDQDIVLVVLSRSVTLSSMVMPVCLDWKDSLPVPRNKEIAYLAKWEVPQKVTSSLPYWTTLEFMDFATCSVANGKGERLTKDKFCASQNKGSDADADDLEGGLTLIREGVHYLYGIVNTQIFGEVKNIRVFTSTQNKTYRDWMLQTMRRVHSQREVSVSVCNANKDCPQDTICSDEGRCANPCSIACSKDCSCEVNNHILTCVCDISGTQNRLQGSVTKKNEVSRPNYEQGAGDVCRQDGTTLYTCLRRSECLGRWGTSSKEAERSREPCNNQSQNNKDPLVCCVWTKGETEEDENGKMCRWFAQSVYSQVQGDNGTFTLEDTCALYSENLELDTWSALQKRELPHMALVADKNMQRWCFGVLISDMFILSSAYCLRMNEPMAKARLGVYDPYAKDTATDYDVAEVIIHPQYDDNGYYNNVGLVKLKTRVQFNAHVRPACLYTKHVFPDTPVMIVGRLDDVTYKEITSVISRLECEKIVGGEEKFDKGVMDESMVCVKALGNLKFLGALPLQVKLDEPYCMYGLVGISSYLHKGKTRTFDVPVYMRVSHYIPWIENIVWPKQATLTIPGRYPRMYEGVILSTEKARQKVQH